MSTTHARVQPDLSKALDDAGAPISPPTIGTLRQARESRDPVVRQLAHRLEQAIRAEAHDRSSLKNTARYFLAIFGLIALLIFLGGSLGRQAFSYTVVPLIVGWMGGFTWWVRFRERQALGGLIARSAVAEGLCGQCCYNLRGIETEADGLIRCPECSARWNAMRPQSASFATSNGVIARGTSNFQAWADRYRPRANIIPDDRGVLTHAPRSSLEDVPRPHLAAISVARRKRLLANTRESGMTLRLANTAFVSVIGCVIAGTVIQAVRLHLRFGTFATLPSILWVLMAAVPFFAYQARSVLRSELGVNPAHTARILVDDGLCGACADDLAQAPVESDGCDVCVTCGAAWRRGPAAPKSHAL